MYRMVERSSNRREFAVGIDLGTTNSCVAVWLNGQVKIIPADDHGGLVTPSCVAFTEHERIIGAAAFNQMAVNPANSIFDAKRLIGRNFSDSTVQDDVKLWPFKVVEGERGKPKIVVMYRGEEMRLSAEEISSMLLAKLRGYAEVFLGTKVRNAVITVPAYFSDSQRQATKDAGRIAGLNVLRIVNEPTAAAIAYGLDRKEEGEAAGKQNVLIFDLGGGTFDVSILEIEGGELTVKATGGHTHLGGEDFDHRLVQFFAGEFKTKHGSDISGDPRALRRLRTACEKAKRNLSISVETTVEVECLLDGIDFVSTITRAKFDDLNKDLFEKCMKIVESCLNDAGMGKESIHDVVLVGGSTRIVKIKELLQEFFGGKELSHRIHPDEAVAHGAALHAAMLNGDLQDMVLRDVVPLSLGVKTYGGLMSVVIPRNTTVPTVQEKTGFTTAMDWQTCVNFSIYEGERRLTEGNNLLGHCRIVGIPPAPAGLPRFTVRFSIDEDGLLHVLAVEQCMGNTAETRIDSTRGILLQEEIERMVRDAERYREEDEARRKKVVARNALETFAYQVRNSANRTEFAARLSESESSAVTQALAACFERLEVREVPELSECDEMRRKLVEVWRPIVTRVLGGPP